MTSLARLARLNEGSRIGGDVDARFCEGLGVKFPRATLPAVKQRFAMQHIRPHSPDASHHLLHRIGRFVPLGDLRHGGDSDRPTPHSGHCVFDHIRR